MRNDRRKHHDADSSYLKYRGGENKTSTTLLLRLKDGDTLAWADFMQLYAPLIRYWCRKRQNILSRTERQDITQDVINKVIKGIHQFEHTRTDRHFRAWLRSITEHRIYDYLHEREARKDVSRLYSDTGHIKYPVQQTSAPDFDALEIEEDEGEQQVLLKQIVKRIRNEFREKSWDVFHLLVIAEKPSSEVAEIMQMQPAAVRKIRSRILKRLREEYAKFGLETDLPNSVESKDN